MTTRCFAFGCSVTNWMWGTCADFIGVNYDKYYNFGKPGASNTFSMSRMIEVDAIHQFNPATDLVVIGMTGFGRLSYFNEKWHTDGDILWGDRPHPNAIDIFNHHWGLYNSYVAMKTIKEYLTLKNIPHVIYPSIEYEHWINDPDLVQIGPEEVEKAKEIEQLLDVTEPIMGFVNKRRRDSALGILFNDGDKEGHPSQQEHYDYLCKHLPQYNTLATQYAFHNLERNFDRSTRHAQSSKFPTVFPHRITMPDRLFVNNET